MSKYLLTAFLGVIAFFLTSFSEIFYTGDWPILICTFLAASIFIQTSSNQSLARLLTSSVVMGLLYGSIIMIPSELWTSQATPKPFDYKIVIIHGLVLAFVFFIGRLTGAVSNELINLQKK